MNFRIDINGLRAWAILSVIFFHYHLFNCVSGFVGVDVFFVISGYLMTRIIVTDLFSGADSFSILRFYLLRARRIIPPLWVLCICLIIMGYYLLSGPEYHLLSLYIVRSLAFISNITYYHQANYFDAAANTKWLLHTWSLAVEWQFYMVLPVLLFVAHRIKPNRSFVKKIIFYLMCLSLGCSIYITPRSPEYGFYMLSTRAWEMLLGGCVFLQCENLALDIKKQFALEYVGFSLIVLSLFIFNQSNQWPGWHALVPTIGAALVIIAKRNNSFLTANKLFQYIGTISYSLYLWHWPIYVYMVYHNYEKNTMYMYLSLFTAFICAHLSYKWVEKPSKNLFNDKFYALSLIKIATSVCAFLIIPQYIIAHQGLLSPSSFKVKAIADEAMNKNPRERSCETLQKNDPTKPIECTYGGKELGVILLGDSHASAIVLALEKALPNRNLHVLDWSILACPAALEYRSGPESYKQCAVSNQIFLEKSKSIPNNVPLLMVNYQNLPNRMEMACEFAKYRPVYLLMPTPEMKDNVPTAMSHNFLLGKKDIRVGITMKQYNKRYAADIKLMHKVAKKCGIQLLDTIPYLCSEHYCYGDINGLPIYYDVHHLNLRGADLLVPELKKVFT